MKGIGSELIPILIRLQDLESQVEKQYGASVTPGHAEEEGDSFIQLAIGARLSVIAWMRQNSKDEMNVDGYRIALVEKTLHDFRDGELIWEQKTISLHIEEVA